MISKLVCKETVIKKKNWYQEKCHIQKEVACVHNTMTKHHVTWNASQFCIHREMFHELIPLVQAETNLQIT